MPGCFESQSDRCARTIASLQAENQVLRKQLVKQTNDLIALYAKVEVLKEQNQANNRNLNLSQKVISREIEEAKRYRRKIRRERKRRIELENRYRQHRENNQQQQKNCQPQAAITEQNDKQKAMASDAV